MQASQDKTILFFIDGLAKPMTLFSGFVVVFPDRVGTQWGGGKSDERKYTQTWNEPGHLVQS